MNEKKALEGAKERVPVSVLLSLSCTGGGGRVGGERGAASLEYPRTDSSPSRFIAMLQGHYPIIYLFVARGEGGLSRERAHCCSRRVIIPLSLPLFLFLSPLYISPSDISLPFPSRTIDFPSHGRKIAVLARVTARC